MNRLARLGVVALFAFALTIMLFGSLSSTPAMPAMKDPPPLHYKSRAGLMPPAYAPSTYTSLRSSSAATFRFLSPYITTTVGSWPQVLALANLSGDARTDAALATDGYSDSANDEMLHLFAGQAGDLVSRTQRLPAGSGPESIVAGDFDRDGRQDIALALAGEDALLLYTQTASHTLTSTLSLDRPGAPNALTAGDFTGDLRDDLAAIAPLSGTLHLWESTAAGLATLPFTLPYPTGGYDALDVGDLDNDGDDDLVALRGAGYLTNSIVIYWQDAGHFPISTTLTPETGGYLPHSLAVGDVTGDGLDDIAVTAGGNAPDAFLNVFAQGASGPATTPIIYAAHHLPSAVAIGDVDHDGLNDVVVTHDAWQTLSVYTQTVSGTLAAYATAPIPYSDRYRPDALGLADLDGNGGLDAALVDRDHGLVILTNTLSALDAAVVSPTHTSLHLPGPLTISGAASTDAVTVEVRLKGHTDWTTATLNGATWGLSLTLLGEERAWWIEARAIDAQGHIQSPPDRVRIGVEDGPPRGSLIINGGAYATNQPTVTLALPAYDVGGVEAMRFTLDGEFFTDWITYTRTHTWTFSSGDGLKSLSVEFRDVNGNHSDLISDTIVLDTALPSSAVDALPDISAQRAITVSWTGTDTGSGIAFYDVQMQQLPTETWRSLQYHTSLTQTSITLQRHYTYCFRSRAIDRAGNVEVWPNEPDACTYLRPQTLGLELSPAMATKGQAAGRTVRYTLTVTNTGDVESTVALDIAGNAWTTELSDSSVLLPADEWSSVGVSVTIPSTATIGASDTVTVSATTGGVSEASVLTTEVNTAHIYLPLVVRNSS